MAAFALPRPNDPKVNLLRHRVFYGETDRMGWVYYGNYPAWFERGRTELMRQVGIPYREMETTGHYLPARRCDIRYRAPARYDDEVLIVTAVRKVRRASLEFMTVVYNIEEKPLVEGMVELVCVDSAARPQPLPDEVRLALNDVSMEAIP